MRSGRTAKRKHSRFYLFLVARALVVHSLIISVILFMTGVSCMLRQEPEHRVLTRVWYIGPSEMREINNVIYFGGRPETNEWIRRDICRTQNTNDDDKEKIQQNRPFTVAWKINLIFSHLPLGPKRKSQHNSSGPIPMKRKNILDVRVTRFSVSIISPTVTFTFHLREFVGRNRTDRPINKKQNPRSINNSINI